MCPFAEDKNAKEKQTGTIQKGLYSDTNIQC